MAHPIRDSMSPFYVLPLILLLILNFLSFTFFLFRKKTFIDKM